MLGGLEVAGVRWDGVSVYVGNDEDGGDFDGDEGGIDILGTCGFGLVLGEILGLTFMS